MFSARKDDRSPEKRGGKNLLFGLYDRGYFDPGAYARYLVDLGYSEEAIDEATARTLG